MSPAKRALVVIAVLVCTLALGAALFIFHWRRPLPAASVGTPPDIMSLIPGDAPIVAYIDVGALKRLQGTPVADMLGLAGSDPKQDREYQDFVRDTGFDYTRDLDRTALAFWPGRTNDGDRALAIADGHFDQSKIKAYALKTGKIIAGGSQQIYLVPGSPPVALEFLDAKRIALASGPHAEDLVAGIKSSPRDPAMQARVDRVAGAPFFAAARADNLPPAFYDNLRSTPELEKLTRSVQSMTLAGEPDGNLIHLTLDAECDSMKDAVALATVVDGLRLLGSMALSDPKTRSQMTKEQFAFLKAVLNQAKLSHQDRWVRLTLDVTPAMLGASNVGPGVQTRGLSPIISSRNARVSSFAGAPGL